MLKEGKTMAEEKPVHEQVADLLATWNPPPSDNPLAPILGQPVPDGDGRATNAVRSEDLDHPRNAGSDQIDAERMFADDGDRATVGEDDDEADESEDTYDDMTVTELKAEIESRNEDRDEDDHLSKTGNKAELVARLEEDDEEE